MISISKLVKTNSCPIIIVGLLLNTTVMAEEKTFTSENVIVSASRIPISESAVGSAVTLIDSRELAKEQNKLVADILRNVPGVAVSRTGPVGGLTQVRIRGAESNHTLVFIDGIEVNNPASGSEYSFDHLLAADIETIEILRGPQSALYGSDAVGGVISIVTKKTQQGSRISAHLESGSFNTNAASLKVNYKSEQFYISGLVQGLKSDGISAADEQNGNTEEDGVKNNSFQVNVGGSVNSELDIDIMVNQINTEVDNDNFDFLTSTISDSQETFENKQQMGFVKLNYAPVDGQWNHHLHLSQSKTDSEFFDGNHKSTFSSEGGKEKIELQSSLFFSTQQLDNEEHTVTLAIEREKISQHTESLFSGIDDRDLTNQSIVSEYLINIWGNLFLSASVRFDDNDALFEDDTTHRVTAAYLIEAQGLRFHSSSGTGVKNPTLTELFGFSNTFTGNKDLKSEKNRGWDFGIEFTTPSQNFIVDATVFQNSITDLITSSGNTAKNNNGRSRIRGFELSALAQLTPSIGMGLNYTYTNSEDPDGSDLIRRAKNIASANFDYNTQMFNNPSSVRLGIQHNGEQDDDDFSTFPATKVTLDAFTLVNLSLSTQLTQDLKLGFRAENITDEQYQQVVGYGSEGISAYLNLHWNKVL